MKKFFAISLFLLLPLSAQAATITVGSGQDYTTIQGALDSSPSAGDTISIVDAGYYDEVLTLKDSGSTGVGNRITLKNNSGGTVTVRGSNAPLLYINGYDYWTIDGVGFEYTGTEAGYTNSCINQGSGTSSYVTIQNFAINYTGIGSESLAYAIYLSQIDNWLLYNGTIDINNTGTHSRTGATGTTGNPVTAIIVYPGADYTIREVDINANGGDMEATEDGMVLMGPNILVEDCLIYDGNHREDMSGHNDGIVIQVDDGGNPAYYPGPITIRRNTLRNWNQCFYLDPLWGDLDTVYFYNNIIYFTSDHDWYGVGIAIDGEDFGCGGSNCKTPVEVYNNVIDMGQHGKSYANYNGLNILRQNASGTDNQQIFKNNIWMELGTNLIEIQSGGSHVTFDRNFYENCDSNSWYLGSSLNWTQWQAISQDTNSPTPSADGGINADYTLASEESTPYNAGESLSSLFTTDFINVSRPQGAAWDIGAYEYVLGSPPSITSVGMSNGE